MKGSLERLLISSRFVNKHHRHVQFLFSVGRLIKIISSETAWANIVKYYTGSIYGRASIRFHHFLTIGQQAWSLWIILLSGCLKINKSSPLKLGGTMNCYFVRIMYKLSVFRVDCTTDMAAIKPIY